MRQQLNESGIHFVTQSLTGPTGRYLYGRGTKVQARAKQLCPVDTGRLRASISVDISNADGELVVRVGTNVKYGRFVHEGTGIYGPRARPIKPTHGQVLVFTPRGGATVYAASVRGTRGTPFLREALKAAVA